MLVVTSVKLSYSCFEYERVVTDWMVISELLVVLVYVS